MKRNRVIASTSVVVLLALLFFFVPLPINRIFSTGLVMATSDGQDVVRLHHEAILARLLVKESEKVVEGQELAVFTNIQVESELAKSIAERDQSRRYYDFLHRLKDNTLEPIRRGEIDVEIQTSLGEIKRTEAEIGGLEMIKRDRLILRAPRAGIVTGLLGESDLGKTFPSDTPVCQVVQPGQLMVCLPVEPAEWNQLKENVQPLTYAAAQTGRHLQRRVAVDYREMELQDALDDVAKQSQATVVIDPEARGVEKILHEKVKLEGKKLRLSTVLDRLLTGFGLGYIVLSQSGDARDGSIVIRPGRERGSPFNPVLADLPVYLRVQGRDSKTFRGRLLPLPESENQKIPPMLTSRAGGPIAIKSGSTPDNLVPQTQQFLVYIELLDPDTAVLPGNMVVAKIYCKSMTCSHWLWRSVNSLFNLSLW